MRKALLVVTTLLVASLTAARADVNSNAAPADEYFGPYKQSVLEIRNRLNDYDQCDTSAMLDPSVPAYLDHLQLAIRDWQHKYPRDPWLPWIYAHLVREYWRAGQSSSDSGLAALAVMRGTYPDAPATAATVALVYGSNRALTNATRDEEAVQYAAAPPPAAYPAIPSYATWPSYGSDAAAYQPPASEAPANDLAASDARPVDGAPTTDVAPPAVDPYASDSEAPPDNDVPTPPPAQ
jgi:hypothetical protein